jgi:hypothetical protein
LCETSTGHNDPPNGNNNAYPGRWALETEHDGVRWDLAEDVGYEEYHVGDVVVGSGHFEVLLEAFDFGVTDVGSV